MEEKFIEIYDKYKNDVFRIAFSYTKSISDAEDITQNVFIKLFNNFDGLKNQDYLKKWLIKVTINEAKSILLSSWKKKIRLTQINDENLHKTEFKIDETIEDILKLCDRNIGNKFLTPNKNLKILIKNGQINFESKL